jgi:GT2 family glycosyltransferase
MARGEYLCFMDQDDIGYENMLEQRMSHLDPETDLLYTDADIIDARGLTSRQAIHRNHGHGLPHPKRSLEDILFKDIVVMTGLLTIKKEIFLRVGGFDENLSGYEDDDLFLRIFEIGKIKYLPVPTLKWRVYDESCSQTDRMIKSRSYYFQKLISRYTDEGGNQKRLRTISWRFFRLFLLEASRQLDQNKKLFGENMAGVRKTLPMISPHRRIFFHLLFLLEGEKAVRLFRWIYQKRRRLLMSSFFSYEFS